MEISGNAFSAGLSGIQAGQRRVEQAAGEIASSAVTAPPANPPQGPQPVNPGSESQANGSVDLPPVWAEHTVLPEDPARLDPADIGSGRDGWIDEWIAILEG